MWRVGWAWLNRLIIPSLEVWVPPNIDTYMRATNLSCYALTLLTPNDGEIAGNLTEALCELETQARRSLQALDINACSVAVLSAFMLQAMLCSNGGVALKTIGNASSLR